VEGLFHQVTGQAQAAREAIEELFSALSKAGPYDAEKGPTPVVGDQRLGVGKDAEYGGIHIGGRVKGAGRDAPYDLGSSVDLDAHGQEAHLAGGGDDALGHLPLHHDHQEGGPDGGLQEAAQRRRGDIVGQVGDDFVAALV